MSNRVIIDVEITKTRTDPTEYTNIAISDDYGNERIMAPDVIPTEPKELFLWCRENLGEIGQDILSACSDPLLSSGVEIEGTYFDIDTIRTWLT